jgi:hypothetical protein
MEQKLKLYFEKEVISSDVSRITKWMSKKSNQSFEETQHSWEVPIFSHPTSKVNSLNNVNQEW